MSEVTRLLDAMDRGEPKAAEELLPLVYEELRRLAADKMAVEPPGQTIQATALVHEAWLKLAAEDHAWRGRDHFFRAAAEAMRRILIDRARCRRRMKHGGGQERLCLEAIDVAVESSSDQVLEVDEALEQLARHDPEKAELVKLRYFAGLRIPEAAAVLGISVSTAQRHWVYARAWLIDALRQRG
jgi:RNA polymerase sigma factor (TIGR02999 family)